MASKDRQLVVQHEGLGVLRESAPPRQPDESEGAMDESRQEREHHASSLADVILAGQGGGGEFVHRSRSPRRYLTILVPGTMVMCVTTVTMYGGARLADDLGTGVFDRFRSLPIWRGTFVVAGLLADVGRYLLAAGIVASLGVAIGYLPDGVAAGVLAAIALVVAFGVSLSWMWTVVALVILDSATVMSLASVVVCHLTFASNVFVPARTKPGWLQAFVDNNPVSHLASAARDLMNNAGGAGSPVV
jgi:ABC-2 type transport system permease protein